MEATTQVNRAAESTIKSTLTFTESITNLVKALAAATLEFSPVVKDKDNFFKSKYADLESVIASTRGPLAKNGLVIIQSPGEITGNKIRITTTLAHASGERITDVLEMLVSKMDAQGVGSAITYGRRYAYQSMTNVAGEADDDGRAATDPGNDNTPPKKGNQIPPRQQPNASKTPAPKNDATTKPPVAELSTRAQEFLTNFDKEAANLEWPERTHRDALGAWMKAQKTKTNINNLTDDQHIWAVLSLGNGDLKKYVPAQKKAA